MRVLIATDGSPSSAAAVREVAGRPWPPKTEVRAVTVDAPLGTPIFGGRAPVFSSFDEFVHAERIEAIRRVEEAASELRRAGPGLTVTAAVLEGSPKEAIIEEARRWAADLVVVGSQGRGSVKSLLLGSVSLALVMGAPCSVLVVRPAAGHGAN